LPNATGFAARLICTIDNSLADYLPVRHCSVKATGQNLPMETGQGLPIAQHGL
jgi:hypothetical protein